MDTASVSEAVVYGDERAELYLPLLEGKRTGAEWMHPFDAKVTNAVFGSMKESFEDWKNERGEELRKRNADWMETIKEGLEEYYDIFL